ncbi:MAG: DUF2088 domain-containing protein [Deltaproteobacteria bacterium]|nr:DUF2088 domain-containing protein [Deltaproteobacteria bacterium]
MGEPPKDFASIEAVEAELVRCERAGEIDSTTFESKRVALIVPDATRPFDPRVIEPLFRRLRGATEVVVIVGLGLHRRLTAAERRPYELTFRGVELLEHDAVSGCREVNRGVGLNERLFEADVIVAVGVVELHQYAGFSGGSKAISIGCGSRVTISRLHGTELLRDRRVQIGRVHDNPFREALDAIAKTLRAELLGLQFVPSAGVVVFGRLGDSFEAAVAFAEPRSLRVVGAPFDAIVLEVPSSKAMSFYQASRAATYVAEVPSPAIVEGGSLIIVAECPEGHGQGIGERAFEQAILRGRHRVLEELRLGVEAGGGAQRAMVLARVLERFRVALVGPELPGLAAFGVDRFRKLSEVRLNGSVAKIDPFECLPRLRER